MDIIYYKVDDISRMFNVNPETVRRWIRNGELVATKSSNKTGNKISEIALEDFLQTHPKYDPNAKAVLQKIDISHDIKSISYEDLEKLVRKIVIEELEKREGVCD